jgi:FkbM family methyltransferase
MTHHITLPFQHRENVSWVMDLSADHPQNTAIKHYLDPGGLPEAELIQVMARAIRPGDFVIDCGACTGFFTLLMAALGASVLAIEPGENNLPLLYNNVHMNKFPIDVRPVALGASIGKKPFLLIDDGGANSFTQPADREPGEEVMVDVRRLPDLIHRNPRFIKMDIEGAEFEVLQTWMRGPWTCPFIVIELNLEALRRGGVRGIELVDVMRFYGYEMFILFSDGMMPMWLPPGVDLKCSRQNTDVLFCKPADLCQLWPELLV